MVSGRAGGSRIELRDLHGTQLDGEHAYRRFNPAAGLPFDLTPRLGLYGSFTQSLRVPTPSELGCADPLAPCRLPNAFVADPPLDEVIARTWEGGIRRRGPALQWSAVAFRTRNARDIIFVSSGALSNQGFFQTSQARLGTASNRNLRLPAGPGSGLPPTPACARRSIARSS